jgi:hypothetical protein
MDTMKCKHCGTNVDFQSADHGRQFVCTTCGKPGIYGFGADAADASPTTTAATSPFATASGSGQPVPAPIKPKSAGGVLTWVGGGVIGVAAIFGLIGKGAKHAGKAAKAIPTRTIPAQLPSKFMASPYKAAPASTGFAPSVAPNAAGGMTYVPLGAGIHASRAASRAMTGEEKKDQPLAAPPPVPGLPIPGEP